MWTTFEHQPERARELVGTLFDGNIIFRPIETSEGPRFELEGLAGPGGLLAVEGLADQAGVPNRASPRPLERGHGNATATGSDGLTYSLGPRPR